MNKYLISLTVLIIFLVGAYYLLFTNPEQQVSIVPTSTPESIKVGMMLPLSGDNSSLGESVLAGAQLAVKEINDAGGVNNRPLEIIFEDDQCSKEGGVAAMTKLIVNNHAQVILGSLCNDAANGANPVAQAAGVPTIILGASAPDLTKVGNFIFSIYPSDVMQGRSAAEYFIQTLQKNKVAVVTVKSEWGENILKSFTDRFKELGGKIVLGEVVATDAKDFKSVVNKIKLAKPDVIYLPTPPVLALSLLTQIRNLKLKQPVIGNLLWDNDALLWSAKEASGTAYLLPQNNNFEDFKNKLKNATGKEANMFSSLAYDAVGLLSEVMKQSGTDQKSLRDALSGVSFNKSISLPVIEFNENRELKNLPLSLKVVGQTVKVEKAQ